MTSPPTRVTRPSGNAGADGPFSSGSITTVLDAPGDPKQPPPPPGRDSSLPKMFRSCLDPLQPTTDPPSVRGLKAINASGSSQFSRSQLVRILASGRVRPPLIVVDLRQESHGFVHIRAPLFEESTIAVGWFAERDWMNVGKGLPSIDLDQRQRLFDAGTTPELVVYWILNKTAEDGIAQADPYAVVPSGSAAEQEIVQALGLKYVRFPTTDHVRPRDAEVDAFVRFAAALTRGAWLHFHCRGGDGRTTTFMVMHDIMCNAPAVPVDDIVRRQFLIHGADLDKPVNPASFASPFAIERRDFVRDFYDYVCQARPAYTLTWSAWIAARAQAPPAGGKRAVRAAGR